MEEDLNNLQKKYANLENEYDKANEGLIEANTKLETTDKRLNEVSALETSCTSGRQSRGRFDRFTDNYAAASVLFLSRFS